MSAFYAVAFEDRIHLLTDGAVYAPDGTLIAIARKVWTSSSAPIAVTGRGDSEAVSTFAKGLVDLVEASSFDGMIEKLEARFANARAREGAIPLEILIAGWSEARGPQLLYFATVEMGGRPAFVMLDAGPEICGGTANLLTPEEIDAAGVFIEPGKDMADIAIPFFDLMRAKKGAHPVSPDLPAIHGIGGHLDMTTVTASGASTRRLHTWPDVVGEKIDPTRIVQSEAA